MSLADKNTFENNTHYFLSYVIQGYPNKPSEDNKQHYKTFIETIINILHPTIYSNLLKEYLLKYPITNDVLNTRYSFFKWFTRILITNLFQTDTDRQQAEDDILAKLNLFIDNIDPKIWGRVSWSFILDRINDYIEPFTEEKKNNYKIMLSYLQHVLPCHDCRNNYVTELKMNPVNNLILENRKTLIVWYSRIKNSVNNRVTLSKYSKYSTFIPELVGITSYKPARDDTTSVQKPISHYAIAQPKEIKQQITPIRETKPVYTYQAPYLTTSNPSFNSKYSYTTPPVNPYANLKQGRPGGCKCGGRR
jgi:hypothetical protein